MVDRPEQADACEDGFGTDASVSAKGERRLSWIGKASCAVVLLWVLVSIFGPVLAPFHEADIAADDGFLPAGGAFLLGTDYLGRDVLSRLLWGARTTTGIAVLSTVLAYANGVTLGIAAAVSKGLIDSVLCRINEAVLSMPTIMLGLIVIAALGSSIPILVGVAAVVYSASVFRIARALALGIMVQDFVEAARVRGEGTGWIVFREILPGSLMPLATDFGINLVFIILFISSLSFLGLGVQPPTSDWGSMVRENLQGLGYGSLAPIAPALAIASLTVSINLIVDDVSAQRGGTLAEKMV